VLGFTPTLGQSRVATVTNVYKPMKVTSRGGTRYSVTFIDNFSKKTHVYLLKAKGKVFEKFKAYKALVEDQTGMKIKTL
jgi:negative regulator of sigma E activity